MSTVNRVSLGELTDIVTKGTTPTTLKKEFVSSGIPFLRINNLDNGIINYEDILYIDDDSNRLLNRSVVKPGDFLLTIAGTIGKTAIVPDDAPLMNCNQAIAIIRVKDILDKKYLKYWLNTPDANTQISSAKVTATISNLSLGQIKELKIPLPSLEEQKRIAAILDKADAIRRKRQQAIALTDQFLRSVFLDLFGDPVTNPKGWKIAPLSTIVSALEGGKNVNPDESGNLTLNRVLKVSAVTSGIFLPEESKPLPDNFEPPKSYFVKKGDLLISRANTTELIGATAFVTETPGNIVLPDKIWRFIWKDENNIHPLYVHYLFRQSHIRREISIRSSGTSGSMKNIPKPKLLEILVPMPPVSEQNKFGTMVEKVINTNGKLSVSHREITILFNSLIQRAFRGELNRAG